MAKAEVTQAQQSFSELVVRVGNGKERIVIEQQGQGFVALISYEDFKRLEALEADARDIEEVEKRIAANEETVTLEQVVEGYNQLHGTNLTLESIINE